MIECLKSRYRLSEFFYTDKDNETLSYLDNNHYDKIDLRFARQCGNKCTKTDCNFTFYMFYDLAYHQENLLTIRFHRRNFFYYAVPSRSSFHFWTKFFALVSFFGQASFLSVVLKMNELTKTYLRSKHKSSIIRITLWISLVSSFYIAYDKAQPIYKEFIDKSIFTYSFIQTPFKPIHFSLALCKRLTLTNLEKISLYELEQQSPSLSNLSVIPFKEKFINNIKELEFTTDHIQRTFYVGSKGNLEKCNSYDILIEEPRYRSLLSLTSLIVNLTEYRFMYLNQYNRTFTTKSLRLDYKSNIIKLEEEVLDCEVYNSPIVDSSNKTCDSRQNCIGKREREGFASFEFID